MQEEKVVIMLIKKPILVYKIGFINGMAGSRREDKIFSFAAVPKPVITTAR